jgi:hypothetical protein
VSERVDVVRTESCLSHSHSLSQSVTVTPRWTCASAFNSAAQLASHQRSVNSLPSTPLNSTQLHSLPFLTQGEQYAHVCPRCHNGAVTRIKETKCLQICCVDLVPLGSKTIWSVPSSSPRMITDEYALGRSCGICRQSLSLALSRHTLTHCVRN